MEVRKSFYPDKLWNEIRHKTKPKNLLHAFQRQLFFNKKRMEDVEHMLADLPETEEHEQTRDELAKEVKNLSKQVGSKIRFFFSQSAED